MAHDGPCVAAANPRLERVCVKCGHPRKASEPQRALDREAAWLEAAGRMLGVATRDLQDFALARAGTAPVRDLARRDMAREAREELADLANYLRWWLEQLALTRPRDDHATAEAHGRIGNALAYAAAAFEEVRAAERLLDA